MKQAKFKDNKKIENLSRIILSLEVEKHKQVKKWGIQAHTLPTWMMILAEEIGELNKAVLESNPKNMVEELVQVITVAVNIYDAMVSTSRNYKRKRGGR